MDQQNGCTAFSKRALKLISLANISPRYGYRNDIFVKVNVNTFRVINVQQADRYGGKKSGIYYSKYIGKVSWLLLKEFIWRLKIKYLVFSFHPQVFFYMTGATVCIFGVLGGIYTLHYKFVQGNPIFVQLIFSIIILGMVFLSIFFGMFYGLNPIKSTNWYE